MTYAAGVQRNDALEAAIRENRDDPAPYMVYADWLQARGEPLGELIVLQHAGNVTTASSIQGRLKLPPLDFVQPTWRWGLWRSIKLANQRDWMDGTFDPIAAAREVFAHPVCLALEELHTGVLRWDYNHVDVPAVIADAGTYAWAPGLRALHLGDLTDTNVDMAHHVIGDVGAAITKAFPNLETLLLHSGDQSWRGEGQTFLASGLDLPRLRTLTIETCAMTTERLAGILAAELPALERLELWFGSRDYDAIYEIGDLGPLLHEADRFPTVRHLGLRNSELADIFAPAIVFSKIAARLETLDLSMGTLTDVGANILVDHASQLRNLTKLDVSQSYVTPAAIDRLRGVFREVVAGDQKLEAGAIPDAEDRYVSVHE